MTRKKKTDTPKRKRNNYTLDTKDKAKQMYLRGLFLPEISKILEIPIRTLENWQTAEKWNAHRDTPEEITKRAYNMHRSGKSAAEIAKELGISKRTVFRYIKKYEEYERK